MQGVSHRVSPVDARRLCKELHEHDTGSEAADVREDGDAARDLLIEGAQLR
jgi:hypothetical protein